MLLPTQELTPEEAGQQIMAGLEITRFERDQGYVVDCEPKGMLTKLRVLIVLAAMKKEFVRDFEALKAVAEKATNGN